MNAPPTRQRQALIADYVSGRLQGAARRRFERWLGGDAGLVADVERLRLRLERAAVAPVVTPPAAVWVRISAAIEAQDLAARSLARPDPERLRLRRQLRRWQAAAGLSFAASGVLALLLVRGGGAGLGDIAPSTPAASVSVATLPARRPAATAAAMPVFAVPSAPATVVEGLLELPNEPGASWRLRIDASERVIAVQTLGRPALGAGEDYELWWVVDDFMVSLGLLPRAGRWVQPLPRGLLEAGEPRLVVTREPAYGSPAHGPSGPVLASTPVWHRL